MRIEVTIIEDEALASRKAPPESRLKDLLTGGPDELDDMDETRLKDLLRAWNTKRLHSTFGKGDGWYTSYLAGYFYGRFEEYIAQNAIPDEAVARIKREVEHG